MTNFCVRCGEPVVEGRLNCIKCGATYPEPDERDMDWDPTQEEEKEG